MQEFFPESMQSFHLSTAKRRNLSAFRGAKADTLSYNVRALGRRGVLIAGKVIAKTGFLVTFLLIFKKAWFLLLLPLLWLKNKIFGRKDDVS